MRKKGVNIHEEEAINKENIYFHPSVRTAEIDLFHDSRFNMKMLLDTSEVHKMHFNSI